MEKNKVTLPGMFLRHTCIEQLGKGMKKVNQLKKMSAMISK